MKSIGILVVFLSVSAIASPVGKGGACGEGWEAICNDNSCNCYQFVDGNLRYEVAKQICNGFGGELPSIHSEKENRFLYVFPSRFDKGAWLGLTRSSSFSFAWSDGTAFDYSSWKADSPSNGANNSDCVHYVGTSDNGFSTAFEWGDSPCTDLHPVICQKIQTQFAPSTTDTPVPSSSSSPSHPSTEYTDWFTTDSTFDSTTDFMNNPSSTREPLLTCPSNYAKRCFSTGECNCYRLVRLNRTWQDARNFCRNEGADLISIHSEEENIFAYNMVTTVSWIGMTNGDQLWSDGSVISYSNWSSSSQGTIGWGVHLHIRESGTWCAAGASGEDFICKMRLDPIFTQ